MAERAWRTDAQPCSGTSHAQMVSAAYDHGGTLDRDERAALVPRGGGVTQRAHEQITARRAGTDWYGYCYEAGATHAEVLEAEQVGVVMEYYVRCRNAGATHAEVLEAYKAWHYMGSYVRCREAGATHGEVLEASSFGVNILEYAYCREAGATHAEVLEAYVAGALLGLYAYCRKGGASHTEVLEAQAARTDLFWYSACRRAAGSHREALALHFGGGSSFKVVRVGLSALRKACGEHPVRELAEVIATLAQDWAGTADELAACARALLA